MPNPPLPQDPVVHHEPCQKRILVIDDEESILDVMVALLGRLGYEAHPCKNPLAGLELLAFDPLRWDFLITDMIMPQMKGVELARHAKMIRADLPIVLCSGYCEQVDRNAALEAGISGFLSKPFSKEELRMLLAEVAVPGAECAAEQS